MRRHFILYTLIVTAVLGLFLAHRASAASVTLSAPTIEAQAGGTVDVPIQLTGANGLGALHAEMLYDPAVLTVDTVTRGPGAGSNSLLESSNKQAGRLVIGVVNLDGITGDGTLATVRFKVTGNAGAATPLTLQASQAWERESHAEVLVNVQSGQVTIAAAAIGWLIPALVFAAALLLLLVLIFVFARRRRPVLQPAYAPAAYAAPPAPPPTQARTTAPPHLGVPERKSAPTDSRPYQRVEDEFFRLKGQLSTGRLTQQQFETKLQELVVQDAQGRYWMLGADSGKWYVHEGTNWVEGKPY